MNRLAPYLIAAFTLAATAVAADAALTVNVTGGQARPGQTVAVGVFLTNDASDPNGSSSSVNFYNAAIYLEPSPAGGSLGIASRTDSGTGYGAPQFLASGDFADGGDYRSAASGGDLADGRSRQASSFLADANAGESLSTANGKGLFQTTFSIPANALPGTVYTIRVDDQATSFSTPGADSTLVSFTAGSATITVVAIPEPATMAAFSVGASTLLLRRRRAIA